MTEELKPCPFCGLTGEDIEIGTDGIGWETGYYLNCPRCEMKVLTDTILEERALYKWNTRADSERGEDG